LGYGVIGLLLLTMLVLALISMRKEARYDEPLSGLFLLTLVILGVCTFVALFSAYQAANRFRSSRHASKHKRSNTQSDSTE